MIVEICANSFESAQTAERAGAHRIELCSELSVGGLTPSYGLMEKVISELQIPVHVLIRPRGGNFTYSEAELDIMFKDIELCKKLGIAGVVSGVLQKDHLIDIQATEKLIKVAEGMDFTFHRAIDWCPKPLEELKSLLQLQISRILSSGGCIKAIDGIQNLEEMKKLVGSEIEIMPGGGIDASQVKKFKEAGFHSIHCSASEKVQTLSSSPAIPMQSMLTEGVISRSSFQKIQDILSALA